MFALCTLEHVSYVTYVTILCFKNNDMAILASEKIRFLLLHSPISYSLHETCPFSTLKLLEQYSDTYSVMSVTYIKITLSKLAL